MKTRNVIVVALLNCILAINADPLKWVRTETKLPATIYLCASMYNGNGVIYTIGGHNGTYYNNQVFSYSVSTDAVGVNGQFIGIGMGTAQLHNEYIYYSGGYSNSQRISNVTRYSTATGDFKVVNSLSVGMYNLASALNPNNGIIYAFGGLNGTRLDNIFQYLIDSNQLLRVARLPEGRDRASAIFANNGKAYVFGGEDGSGNSFTDIIEFDPVTRNVTKLAEKLPQYFEYGCAVLVDSDAYIVHYNGLMKFNVESGRAEEIAIDGQSWPLYLTATSCVYVPELRRIYVVGGIGRFQGETEDSHADSISYIDLDIE